MATIFEEISEDLVALNEAKQNIKTAIEGKGQDLTGVPFTQYADKINEISVGGDGDETLKGLIEGTITELTIPSGTTKIAENRFYSDLTITKVNFPSSLKTIGKQVFYNCALTELPNLSNVEYIGNAAFRGCKIVNGFIPKNTELDTGIYYGCKQMQNAEIEEGVTVVPNATFQECSALSTVTIPDTVTHINRIAFQSTGLTSIELPKNLIFIGTQAFYNTKLTNLIMPDSVTTLEDDVFANNTYLTSIKFSSGLETTGKQILMNCKALPDIELPSKLTSIGVSFCYNCSALTRVIVLGNVTTINSNAFYGCKNVLKYDFTHCTQVPTLANVNIFNGINADCKIYVPDTLYDSWITATNWSTYASYIRKASEMPTE